VARRVVFDTNVFVSAYAFGGKPAELIRAAIVGEVVLVTSPPILAELARVLADKLGFEADRVDQVIGQIARIAEVVRPVSRVEIVSDEPDNRVLECAREGAADLIVSGDAHLLELGAFEGIRVLSPSQALALLAYSG
jgi:uncharacterized protein